MQARYSKTFRVIFLVFVLLLIALVTLVYVRQQARTSEVVFMYNGFKFQRDQQGYEIQLFINDQKTPTLIHLREDPRTLETIPIQGNIQILRQKQQLHITLDPYANLTGKTTIAALEIDAIIDNPYLFNIPVNSAFTQPYANGTIKTCADVNATEGVILLEKGDATSITEDKGCILLRGVTEQDLIRAADRLAYTLLNIMQP